MQVPGKDLSVRRRYSEGGTPLAPRRRGAQIWNHAQKHGAETPDQGWAFDSGESHGNIVPKGFLVPISDDRGTVISAVR